MVEQINMFEDMYQSFKFDKKEINLFEAFAGIGSQAVALKKLSREFDFKLNTIGISEIDKHAIASYNAIHGEVKNYGSICDIQELPNDIDIFTYSFPCQDISLAGAGKGFAKGGGTRSGLLWEVERILENNHKTHTLPKVLLMENVKALVGVKFKDDFIQWQLKLQELGYTNYWEVLNAKDYGIPQNRERVFMISVLGKYSYTFPRPFPLKLRLKDMLEDEVDEKYYLSDKQVKQISAWNSQQNPLENAKTKDDEILQCITAKSNTSMNASMLLIKEATKKGYAEATNGDGVYINRPHQKRGVVQKDMIQTIKTSPDVGVVVKDSHIRKLTPKECFRLMGFNDEHFVKAESVCSNTQLYRQAGNSIVVDVLYYIFKPLFDEGATI